MFSSKMNINCQTNENVGCYDVFTLCLFFAFLCIHIYKLHPPPSARIYSISLPWHCMHLCFFSKGIPIDDACLCVQKTRWTGYRCLVLSCFRMFSIEEGPGMLYHVSPCSRCVKSFLKGSDRRTKVVGLVAPVAVLLSPRPLLLHRRWIKG